MQREVHAVVGPGQVSQHAHRMAGFTGFCVCRVKQALEAVSALVVQIGVAAAGGFDCGLIQGQSHKIYELEAFKKTKGRGFFVICVLLELR